MKLCIDCKYSKDTRTLFEKTVTFLDRDLKRLNMICTRPEPPEEIEQHIDPVDGKKTTPTLVKSYCKVEREVGSCGMEGKFFAPRQ